MRLSRGQFSLHVASVHISVKTLLSSYYTVFLFCCLFPGQHSYACAGRKQGVASLVYTPHQCIKMGTKQSRLRHKDEKPPSGRLGWRKRRTCDNAPSEKEKEEVEGAAHTVGQAATPSPGINSMRTRRACCELPW